MAKTTARRAAALPSSEGAPRGKTDNAPSCSGHGARRCAVLTHWCSNWPTWLLYPLLHLICVTRLLSTRRSFLSIYLYSSPGIFIPQHKQCLCKTAPTSSGRASSRYAAGPPSPREVLRSRRSGCCSRERVEGASRSSRGWRLLLARISAVRLSSWGNWLNVSLPSTLLLACV